MIDAAAPKAAGELFAQLNGPCPISPPKPEKHDAGSAGGGEGGGGLWCGSATQANSNRLNLKSRRRRKS